jgi:hypothetical protein
VAGLYALRREVERRTDEGEYPAAGVRTRSRRRREGCWRNRSTYPPLSLLMLIAAQVDNWAEKAQMRNGVRPDDETVRRIETGRIRNTFLLFK